MLYLIYRDGLLGGDIKKLLAHAQLPPQDGEVIYNLDLLGVRVEKPLKDTKPAHQPLFVRKPPAAAAAETEEVSLSRFEPNLKIMLEAHFRGTLDRAVFPFTRPTPEGDGMPGVETLSQSSLRSAKPTWARTRSSADQPRQRIIVFMAGGATYAEARACYEVSQASGKDVYLATSHLLTPRLFLRQLGELSVDKRRLDIPAERPRKQAPAHLFEREPAPAPAAPTPAPISKKPIPALNPPVPPGDAMAAMSINPRPNGSSGALPPKPHKEEKEKKKKKHHFFK
jgi:syntaxin-binding protein 1